MNISEEHVREGSHELINWVTCMIKDIIPEKDQDPAFVAFTMSQMFSRMIVICHATYCPDKSLDQFFEELHKTATGEK